MRPIPSLALFGLLAAPVGSAFAEDAGAIAPAFGNTIVSTYPDGRKAELWLSPDGSYTGEGRGGDRSNGHWRIKGARLCFKQSRPIPMPFSYCTPLPGAVDVAWTGKAVTGETIRIAVVPGHVEARAAR